MILDSYVSDWPVISVHTIWREERNLIAHNTLRNEEKKPRNLQKSEVSRAPMKSSLIAVFLLITTLFVQKTIQKDKDFLLNYPFFDHTTIISNISFMGINFQGKWSTLIYMYISSFYTKSSYPTVVVVEGKSSVYYKINLHVRLHC